MTPQDGQDGRYPGREPAGGHWHERKDRDRDKGRGKDKDKDKDYVAEFFASHRERVPELTPDELTWRRIRDEHRRRGRSARRTSAAGMAVAAAALAVGAYAVWPHLDPDPGPTAQQGGAPQPVATEEPDAAGTTGTGPQGAGEEATEETGSTLADEPEGADSTAAPGPGDPLDPGELPEPVAAGETGPGLPEELVLTAVSQDRQGGMTAVGSGEASDPSRGPVLLRAPDATGPWEAVADLTPLELGVAAEGDDEDAGATTGVEFADADTGYAWAGESLHVTSDGGATWQRLPLDDLLVHDVIVRGETVHVAATGPDCVDGACGGLSLLTGPAGGTELLLTPVVPAEERVPEPVLRNAGEEVYLHAPAGPQDTEATAAGAGSWRWQGGRAEPLALPMECGGPARALAGAPDQPGFVLTACPGEGETPLLVASSPLGGRTWGPASPEVMAPLQQDDATAMGPVHLAAADPGRVALVSGEQTRTSTDGGRSWQQAAEPLPLTSAEVADVAALRDGTLVALAEPDAAEPGGYWASDDGGQRWQRVELAP